MSKFYQLTAFVKFWANILFLSHMITAEPSITFYFNVYHYFVGQPGLI